MASGFGDGAGGRTRQAHAAADRSVPKPLVRLKGATADRPRARPDRRGRHSARGRQRALHGRPARARIWPGASSRESRSPTSATHCSTPAAASCGRCRCSATAPFLIHNSDSVWIEGIGSNLDRLFDAWDGERMDFLLLVALASTSVGYDGRGDFQMRPDGRLSRRARARDGAVRVHRRVDRASARVRGRAARGRSRSTCCGTARSTAGRLFGIRLDGLWMHVGTPEAVDRRRAVHRRAETSPDMAAARTDLTSPARASSPCRRGGRSSMRWRPRSWPAICRAPAAAAVGRWSFPAGPSWLPTRRAARALQEAFLDVSAARGVRGRCCCRGSSRSPRATKT